METLLENDRWLLILVAIIPAYLFLRLIIPRRCKHCGKKHPRGIFIPCRCKDGTSCCPTTKKEDQSSGTQGSR